MVRSETKQPAPPGSSDDMFVAVVETLIRAAFAVVRLEWRMLCWTAAFPMLSGPVVLTAWADVVGGHLAGGAVGVAFAMMLVGWRLARPRSFHRWVSGRIWKRWRRWATYRHPWPELCALHGLTVVLNDKVLVPRLHKVKIGYVTDVLTVRMLYGQTVGDWQATSDALAHAFGAIGVRVRPVKPGWIAVDVHHTDRLAAPILVPTPPPDGPVDTEHLPIGVTDLGEPWTVQVLGRHILVAGATGAGKGSVVWSILTALAPAIHEGLAQVWVIDPKGGMEFGPGQPLFNRFEYDTTDGTLALLRDAVGILTARANRLRGVTRLHTPTVTEPLIVVVIDEMATLTAYAGDRKTRSEIEQLLGLLLSQGRAVGVSVIAAVQDPAKEVLAMRQLFPTRIALRLSEPSQVAMVLGDSARERGALCDQIPDCLPGVGYVAQDGSSGLVRVRAFHVTDDDIVRLSRDFAPPLREAGTEAERPEGDAA